MNGRAGKVAIGRGPTFGGCGGELIEMVREVEPGPEPAAIEAALARWGDAPEVPSVLRLRELAGEIEDLRTELAEVKDLRSAAIAAGDDDRKAAKRAAEIRDAIEARIAAIPAIEQRIPGELIEYHKGEIETLEAEHAEALAAMEAARGEAQAAEERARETAAALSRAKMNALSLGRDLSDARMKVRRLQS